MSTSTFDLYLSVSHSDVMEMHNRVALNRYLANKENIAPQTVRSLLSVNTLLFESGENDDDGQEVDPILLNAVIDSNRTHEPFAVLWEKPSIENKDQKSVKSNPITNGSMMTLSSTIPTQIPTVTPTTITTTTVPTTNNTNNSSRNISTAPPKKKNETKSDTGKSKHSKFTASTPRSLTFFR